MRISDWSSDVCSSDLAAPGIDAVDIERDRLVEGEVRGRGTETANINDIVAGGRLDKDVWRVIHHRFDVGGVEVGKLFAADDLHRNGNVLQILLALLRGEARKRVV